MSDVTKWQIPELSDVAVTLASATCEGQAKCRRCDDTLFVWDAAAGVPDLSLVKCILDARKSHRCVKVIRLRDIGTSSILDHGTALTNQQLRVQASEVEARLAPFTLTPVPDWRAPHLMHRGTVDDLVLYAGMGRVTRIHIRRDFPLYVQERIAPIVQRVVEQTRRMNLLTSPYSV